MAGLKSRKKKTGILLEVNTRLDFSQLAPETPLFLKKHVLPNRIAQEQNYGFAEQILSREGHIFGVQGMPRGARHGMLGLAYQRPDASKQLRQSSFVVMGEGHKETRKVCPPPQKKQPWC